MRRTFYTILGIAGAALSVYALLNLRTTGRIVPKIIADFVLRAFPESELIRIEKAGTGYEAELSDGKILRFDCDGEFVCYV